MVRITRATYSKLAETAGKLQTRLRHRVSLSDALEYLLHKKDKRARLFWSKLREKKLKKRSGRGAYRRPDASENTAPVHSNTNLRPEVA